MRVVCEWVCREIRSLCVLSCDDGMSIDVCVCACMCVCVCGVHTHTQLQKPTKSEWVFLVVKRGGGRGSERGVRLYALPLFYSPGK
jgi:hypothetical protein